MFLLVTRATQLGGKTLPKGVVLCVARDCPSTVFAVQVVLTLESEPRPFNVGDGVDYSFPRRIYPNILEYPSWELLRTAARMCR